MPRKTQPFFFVNKKEAKKTSLNWTVMVKPPMLPFNKSFLVLFFKNEPLPFDRFFQFSYFGSRA
jgi:hypothetical protein